MKWPHWKGNTICQTSLQVCISWHEWSHACMCTAPLSSILTVWGRESRKNCTASSDRGQRIAGTSNVCICSSGRESSLSILNISLANAPLTTSVTAVRFLLAGSIIPFIQILCGDQFLSVRIRCWFHALAKACKRWLTTGRNTQCSTNKSYSLSGSSTSWASKKQKTSWNEQHAHP